MEQHQGFISSNPIFSSILRVTSLFFINLLFSQHATIATNFGNLTDRLALLDFKHQIANDPYAILSSWNDSLPHCQWQGVTCGHRHQRVTALKLDGRSLFGTISPFIGNLSFLRHINLGNNRFYREVPQEVGRLFRLRHLNMTNNTLGGAIPVNLSHCSELRIMDFELNHLIGRIPIELGSLRNLVTLILHYNNLTGEIPQSIGNLSSLAQISAAYNNLEGSIPNEMGQLSLTFFGVAANNLSGMIPASLYNISSITVFSTGQNQLHGSLPANIGLTLPNLQMFGIGANRFSGTIPHSFTNASHLEELDLSTNNFVGQVPTNLGDLQGLQWLNLELNLLGSNTTQDLNFVTSLSNCSNLQVLSFDANHLGGELPNSIANLSNQMGALVLGRNQISGKIPAGLDNLVNLYMLSMEENFFSGAIPTYFGRFQMLQVLLLFENRLNGQIPSSLGNLTHLYNLQLSRNKLEGNIPSSMGNCQNLQNLEMSENNLIGFIPPQVISIFSLSLILNLSRNSLAGSLPLEVGKLKNINALDLSENKLFGAIPGTIGECMSLEYLNMQGNFFQGTIPSSLASLKGIRHLDLSRNNLSGLIPKDLENLSFLQYVNLSFNDLEGQVPTGGVFGNASRISLVGNSKLCGGIPELRLPKCIFKVKKQGKSHALIVVILTVSMVLLLVAITSLYACYWRRNSRKKSSSTSFEVDGILRISYHKLYQATGGFSSGNLIGSGSFGYVYKATLGKQEESLVAVKVLDLQKTGASKSFVAECKALRNIRHRNLVKVITYCSSIDFKGNEFKALVFEFMVNGNLDTWLHPEVVEANSLRTLNLLQRLNIALDVASALHYLHNQCEIPIIHCDLKPSNILLDNDMIAHVSDFGLARLLSNAINNFSQQQFSSIGIKGSVGYVAPEYGMGGEVATYGDVYSYGILLLEMLTGRRPTDDMFRDGLNLHNYVKMALPRRVVQIVDPILLTEGELENGAAAEEEEDDVDNEIMAEEDNRNIVSWGHGREKIQKCIVSILEIGLACSVESPRARMDMNDVTRELHHIRDAFLGSASTRTDHK